MPSDFRWHSFLVSAGYLPDTTGVNITVIKNKTNLGSELKRCGLTLHETTDCKRIQFVPTIIHKAFKHAVGTAEMLERLINGDIHFKVGV